MSDGIPSLDNPKLINADEATYLVNSDLVFGVDINGDIRAYPLRIMGWHEMFNETIGGVPVALAYCTLCGAGILFETKVEGRDEPFIFGSSGFLYRSNKLMFDRQTDSLWNQFTGEPVTGPLVDSGIKLKIRPVVITTWAQWKKSHPTTKVLSLDTGHRRDYGSAIPQIKPHASFRALKTSVFNRIDPAFDRFIGGDRSLPEKMKIRLEEITWGGVPVDGIPSLDSPKLINADEATYLVNGDPVFGVDINGDIRAYPLRIMGWHEMFNETIGGVPVALAYCTLCGAGILFETKVEGRDEPFIFGSSGFLYRSNKLMFDRQTDSLWNQFTGEPVTGPLVDSGIKLKIRPVVITTWAQWKKSHPTTKVLSLVVGWHSLTRQSQTDQRG